MKFVVSDTSSQAIFPKCKIEKLTYLDFRTAPTLTKAKYKNWYSQWYNSGINHREERGMVVCEHKEKYDCHTIEIQDLTNLIRLQTKYKYIEISNSGYLEILKEIHIGECN